MASKSEEATNPSDISCAYPNCSTSYLKTNVGQLKKVDLPENWPKELTPSESLDPEGKVDCWEVTSVMNFENIGVSKDIPGCSQKVLSCADCERGPVGFMTPPIGPCYLFTKQ